MDDMRIGTMSAQASDFGSRSTGAPTSGMYQVKVLDYRDGRATLSVDGRVVKADTEVPLKVNGVYDVMIKGFGGGKVQLQIVSPEMQTAARPMSDDALTSRLMEFDIPVTDTTLRTARALIREDMAVTHRNMTNILDNLRPGLKTNDIDFLVALAREKIPLSREAVDILPTMAKETAELPAAMKAVFESAVKTLSTAAAAEGVPQAAPQITAEALRTMRALADLTPAPQSEGPGVLAEKVAVFARNFMQSSEVKLGAAAELVAAFPPGEAEPATALGGQLLTALTISEQEPAPEAAPALAQSLRNVAANMEKLTLPQAPPAGGEASMAAIRDEAVRQIRAALDSGAPPAQVMASIGETAKQALTQWVETTTAAVKASEETPLPATLPAAMRTPEHLDAVAREIQTLQALLESEGAQSTETRRAIQRLSSDLLPLMALRPSADAYPETNRFIDDTIKWLMNVLKNAEANDGARASNADAAPAKQAAPAPPQPPVVTQAVREEMRELMNLLRETPDLRSLTAEAARASQGGEFAKAATQMARGMESAGASNVVMNDGAKMMDAMVTAFPIRVGDRVEMGFLKVYREHDPQGRAKKLDPENAGIVLLLNTEYIGPSAIHIRTKNKGLTCVIEVENVRKKKALDKFIGELVEGLKGTPFDLREASVRVKRKKAAKDEAETEPKGFTAIDMRV